MNKMMFNDKYGLTWAVLNGKKTQTRRVAKGIPDGLSEVNMADYLQYSRYQVGNVVAIAQSYASICDNAQADPKCAKKRTEIWKTMPEFLPEKVWRNKMFVRPELMPHQIVIDNIRLERLNDISEEDCIQEGIMSWPDGRFDVSPAAQTLLYKLKETKAKTAKEAYARLIDKIGKKGDWEKNPWVFVYDFHVK